MALPKTCREAAFFFRGAAFAANRPQDASLYNAQADILETLGDTPIPEELYRKYRDFHP